MKTPTKIASQESQPLWALSATELVAGYVAGRFTPVDVIESVLERIEGVNPLVNAVVTSDAEGARRAALESAQRHRQGMPLSGIDGVPITVKDNIPVKGMRSTWGSRVFANYTPEADELPVARLRRAGGIIVGKTNCPEFTLQGYTDNVLFGPTRNPWNLALTPVAPVVALSRRWRPAWAPSLLAPMEADRSGAPHRTPDSSA